MTDVGEKRSISRRRFLNAAAVLAAGGALTGTVPALLELSKGSPPSPDVRGEVSQADVISALRKVSDPEIPVNIYDLGLVYDIDIERASGKVEVRMTLTTPKCPANQWIPQMVRTRIEELRGVKEVDLRIVWDPPWSPDMMSVDAREQFEWGLWDLPVHP